jgi:ATP-dependent exoDNAse (exonuclease V) beta subunit
MDEPDVQLVVHLLKFLDNPENDFSLFMVLTSDLFRMSEETIRSIKNKGKNLFLALCNARSDWSITKKLKKLLALVYYMNPYQFIFSICNELGIKISYPLATLLDATIEYMNDGCGSLADFIEWLEHYGPAIEVKETQFEGVRIMTIHKAKGLEFEIVIIPETNWDRSGNKRKLLIPSYSDNARPDNIYLRKYGKYLPGLADKEKELECIDDLNLLYVALTRAKTGIYILGYKRKRGNSGFWFERIKEKFAGKSLPYDEILERRFVIPEKKRIERVYSPVMQKPFTLREERDLYSPTERGIEIIEPARRRGMELGDIVHKALSKIFWLDGLDIEKAMNEVIDDIKRNWVKNPEDVEEIEIRLRKILRDTLTDPDLHFIFYRDTQNKECKNELDLYYEKEKSDVSAHLDRIIIEPQRITIIDYKIGKEKKEYLGQMRDYKQGISIIFPNREVITYLLFLEKNRGNKLRQVL